MDLKAHALALCRSCIVRQWRNTDTKPFISAQDFNQLMPAQGRTWGQRKFRTFFPTLQVGPPVPPSPVQAAAQPPAGPAAQPIFQFDVAVFQQYLAQQREGAMQFEDKEKDDKPAGLAKVSTMEIKHMKIMCGLKEVDAEETLPKWYRDLFHRHQDEKDKQNIITSAIKQTSFFEDAEVPLYPALVKMILKQDWLAGDLGKWAAYVNATKGISPFAMLDMTEEDVAIMTEEYDDMTRATSVTAVEYNNARVQIKAQVPTSSEEFMEMLKRYTNLLFAIFSSQSPLYVELPAIIKALKSLSLNARSKLGHDTKASIILIILLQPRRYAQGEIIGEEACLWEFSNMQTNLLVKNCQVISHIELPDLLKEQTQKKRKCSSWIS